MPHEYENLSVVVVIKKVGYFWIFLTPGIVSCFIFAENRFGRAHYWFFTQQFLGQMTLHFVGMVAALIVHAAALNVGSIRPTRATCGAWSRIFLHDMELLASPFALAMIFPASAFPSGRVTCGRLVKCGCAINLDTHRGPIADHVRCMAVPQPPRGVHTEF
jgi:hypothetical protein